MQQSSAYKGELQYIVSSFYSVISRFLKQFNFLKKAAFYGMSAFVIDI